MISVAFFVLPYFEHWLLFCYLSMTIQYIWNNFTIRFQTSHRVKNVISTKGFICSHYKPTELGIMRSLVTFYRPHGRCTQQLTGGTHTNFWQRIARTLRKPSYQHKSYQIYAPTNFCMCARTGQTKYPGQNSHFKHLHTKKLALFQVKRTIYFTNLCLFSHPMVL
jgi:hypothetical protein